jgi:hypothetical protein
MPIELRAPPHYYYYYYLILLFLLLNTTPTTTTTNNINNNNNNKKIIFQGNVLQFELILKIGSIVCAYGGRQKNISRAPRWTGLAVNHLVVK